MSTHMKDDATDRSEPSSEPEGTATIESYETDDGVVFYDAEKPAGVGRDLPHAHSRSRIWPETVCCHCVPAHPYGGSRVRQK